MIWEGCLFSDGNLEITYKTGHKGALITSDSVTCYS